MQFAIGLGRRHHQISRVVDNQPLVLMAGQRMLSDNLLQARMTQDDVRAKLREANVYNYESIRAVVFETTGDISVLHGEGDSTSTSSRTSSTMGSWKRSTKVAASARDEAGQRSRW